MQSDTMSSMAEDIRRSFDLKSWQGLTDVLRLARESNLDPAAYAEFRNLVLHYAQQKGSDPELKKNIETIIRSFSTKEAAHTPDTTVAADSKGVKMEPAPTASATHGRRLVSSFIPAPSSSVPLPKEKNEDARSGSEPMRSEPVVVSTPEPAEIIQYVPEEIPTAPKIEVQPHGALRSIEEHRARIMEIKRRVNGLIGNPIMLMDHGNHVGREYMSALLNALKATSPGSTLNVEETMTTLESMFVKILEVGTHTEETVNEPLKEESLERETVVIEPTPVIETTPVVEPQPVLPEDVIPESVMPEPVALEETLTSIPESAPEPTPPPIETVPTDETPLPQPPVASNEDKRWSESGGDVDVAAQIKTLREELKAREMSASAHTTAARVTRPIIPSIIDMEEESLPTVEEREAETTPVLESHVPGTDEMSTQSFTHRPLSSMTGITLGTPQAELMTPDVTGVLTQLLHDWSIFASSGLFGMGPSGMDHPLYQKLSRLPMGEVLSGRFEDGDMKLVRIIKDYVDAWRHEQGIAYNPNETFEHYLRRVSQRILKRQSGAKTV